MAILTDNIGFWTQRLWNQRMKPQMSRQNWELGVTFDVLGTRIANWTLGFSF
jgi:hypothetical protein